MAEQESLALFDDTTEELFMKGTMLSTIFYNAENLFCRTRLVKKQMRIGTKRYYRNWLFPSTPRTRSLHFLRKNAGTC